MPGGSPANGATPGTASITLSAIQAAVVVVRTSVALAKVFGAPSGGGGNISYCRGYWRWASRFDRLALQRA